MIEFECQDGISIPSFLDLEQAALWLNRIANLESKSVELVSYVFCNDTFLIDINQEYLNHDTYTDIITFPYDYDPIKAEIYISLSRVQENATTYNQGDLEGELRRVLAHGILHMCGYQDHTENDRKKMRALESHYLTLIC